MSKLANAYDDMLDEIYFVLLYLLCIYEVREDTSQSTMPSSALSSKLLYGWVEISLSLNDEYHLTRISNKK